MTNRIWETKSPESEYGLCSKCNDRFYLEFHKCD